MESIANKPAFPKKSHRSYDEIGDVQYTQGQEGMDIRTWLAGQALTGICQEKYNDYDQIAKHAVGTADAIIKKLEEE